MEAENIREYAQIREEMRHIEDCITDYMKTFYATGAAAAIIVWYLTRSIVERRELLNGVPQGNPGAIDDLILRPQTVGYVSILLSLILLSFSHIIFHKLNTRNRHTGYLRALAYERWSVAQKRSELFLWEICLHLLYNDLAKQIAPQLTNNTKRTAAMEFYSKIDNHFDTTSARWYLNIVRFIFRSFVGIWMTLRTAVRRYDTRSWTFPYVILFGLLGSGGMLLAMWFLCVPNLDLLTRLIQAPIILFLLFGWLGMCNRLYRLCADDGDRTIDAYMYKFLVCREVALKTNGIDCDWDPLPNAPAVVQSKKSRLVVKY